jgi:hypothetical protein
MDNFSEKLSFQNPTIKWRIMSMTALKNYDMNEISFLHNYNITNGLFNAEQKNQIKISHASVRYS